jgi:predicted RNA-binding protein YlxR (DUF448 family)
MGKRSHNPVRTCVACRQEAGKRELLRLVRDADTGEVVIDLSGRASGRGAYLHRDPACIDLAQRRGGLARALKAAVPPAVWTSLQAD